MTRRLTLSGGDLDLGGERVTTSYIKTSKWIVAEAVSGEADVLVTGDGALQKLGKRAPLPILSPRGLWETLRGGKPAR